MFVRAVGLGAFPGVVAIGVAYGGILGKVYAEILEGVDPRAVETLQAAGASRLGLVAYGALPEALPSCISYTLYRWECAIRASAILGFVGAGGLGQQIELSMRMFNFSEVLTLLAILAGLVGGVDALSAWVRRRVAVFAPLDVAAEGGGPAGLDRAHDPPVGGRQRPLVRLAIGLAVAAEDVRHRERRPGHRAGAPDQRPDGEAGGSSSGRGCGSQSSGLVVAHTRLVAICR